uniref:Uncharacterized protein n=1 Tax=Oryza barthii TaxID=65489 RepID=A0A0D3GLS1_9ORYZ
MPRRTRAPWSEPSGAFLKPAGDQIVRATTYYLVPHASPEELLSRNVTVAAVAIDGREDQAMNEHWAVLFEVEEFLLPGIDSLSIAKATTTMRWMNRRRTRYSGGPTMASPNYLCVEKIGTKIAKCRPTQWLVCAPMWRLLGHTFVSSLPSSPTTIIRHGHGLRRRTIRVESWTRGAAARR